MIAILRKLMTHFGHSGDATTKLEEMRKENNSGRGLESIGKTRFGTITWSALSLKRNLAFVLRLVGDREITLKASVLIDCKKEIR